MLTIAKKRGSPISPWPSTLLSFAATHSRCDSRLQTCLRPPNSPGALNFFAMTSSARVLTLDNFAEHQLRKARNSLEFLANGDVYRLPITDWMHETAFALVSQSVLDLRPSCSDFVGSVKFSDRSMTTSVCACYGFSVRYIGCGDT